MDFRKGAVPPSNVPLRLPPLACDLQRAVRDQIRKIRQGARCNFPPLHLPSDRFIEIKGLPWSVIVFNFRASLKTWTPGRPHACARRSFQAHTKALSPTGHVFCHVREVLPGHVLADLNLKDTSYLPNQRWKECAEREVRAWTHRWRLPSEVNMLWGEWIALQEHDTLLGMDRTSTLGQVEPGLQRLQGLVLTPADHLPHTAHVACQFAFDALLDKTFLDRSVFQQCKVGMQSILINLRLEFQGKKTFQHRYQWAVNWTKLLPVARVLPKPSKSFTKARPIIARDRCWHSRLTIFLARALYQVMTTSFPPNSTFNIDSTLLAMRRMWFMTQNSEEPTALVQQDLIGFFNSVPRSRILTSLKFVLRQLLENSGSSWEQQTLQVTSRQNDKSFRIFRGSKRFASRQTKTLWIQDLPGLVEFLLGSSYFTCGSHAFRQIQGAAMGSAFAPVLCTMVANTTQFIMLKHFREAFRSAGLLSGFRYADNRAFLLSTLNPVINDWRRLLLNLEFYGLPILLENGEELLGATCSTQQGAITARQRLDATLLRTLQSVGSRKFVLSGLGLRL